MTRGFRPTLPAARPFEIHPDGAEAGVLMIHGYTGRSGDLLYLGERLAKEGLAVSAPRLPGAGTDMNDLAATTRHDWRRRCLDAWQDLRSRYDTLYLVGYSMGGVLALDLARKVMVNKLVLLAPALRTTHKTLNLLPLLAPFSRILPEVKTNWEPKDEDDEETREHGRRYWSRRDLKSAAQFSRLTAEGRRHLERVMAPVFTVVSLGDKTVPTNVLDLLDRRLPAGLSKSLVVSRCGHDVPQGADKEVVADTVTDWLKYD
ncbi:MAG: alpha/beta fold hydrolase [Spirochaetaceae bacterium]|nr:alpha/beta fold hydrolase [Spirochaetaceae bacterium]MDT8299168.1 alpha/beta fold hydrolase [Spirochaetaceae bacterium]